jgi:hypothetical protein
MSEYFLDPLVTYFIFAAQISKKILLTEDVAKDGGANIASILMGMDMNANSLYCRLLSGCL